MKRALTAEYAEVAEKRYAFPGDLGALGDEFWNERFMRTRARAIFRMAVALCAAALLTLVSCQRERRELLVPPPERATLTVVRDSTLQPGGPLPPAPVKNPYEGNAYAISEGQRLFDQYNCSGCHAHGGGGMGPPLLSHSWIYGGEPANIFETIVRGRPNGMPTWGGRIPEYQIWQIVTYVRSLSGNEPKSATPARPDAMQQTSEVPKTSEPPQ